MAQEPLERQGLLVTDDSRSNSGTPHSVGHLCTSDYPSQRPWQHTTLTWDRHPCPGWNSNPQSQRSSVRRPTL